MNITKVGKRVLPAAFALSVATAGNAVNNNQIQNTQETEQQTEIYTEPKNEEKSNSAVWNDLLYWGIGMASASALLLTAKIAKAKYKSENTDNESEYYTKKFKKDADKLYNYMQDVFTESVTDKNTVSTAEFFIQTGAFKNKYPSRGEYLELFIDTLKEDKLTVKQKEVLCQYFISKATCTSKEEEEDIKKLFPYLENISGYDNMIKAVKNNTDNREIKNTNETVKTPPPAVSESKSDDEDDGGLLFDTVHHNLNFNDVGGQGDAIKQIKRNILFPIKYPKAFEDNSINHGFLFYGPPGTGKTLAAEALANESNAHFIKLNCNELTSEWVGETESNWRKLFKEAKDKQPSIIFIDEFDGISAKRGKGDVHNDKLINQILGLLSDVEKNNSQIYIIATTNRKDMIDPAMLRTGRIGTHIEFKPPRSEEEVMQIFNIHLKKRPISEDLDKSKIVSELFKKKSTGSDIAFVVNSAYETAKERNSIYEKMDNGTFKDSDMDSVVITPDDFEKVLKDFKPDTRTAIGFKK